MIGCRPPLLRLLLCVSLLAGAPSFAQAQRSQPAKLTRIQSPVTVHRSFSGPDITPVAGLLLDAGNVVTTGFKGLAMILFFRNRHQATLYGNSTGVISQDRLSLLPPARARIRGPHRHQRMDIETPTATAHLPGTDVYLTVAEDGTSTVTVSEGEVQFENERGSVVVRAGQQSVARAGQAPTPPVAVNLPFIIQWANEERPALPLLEPTFVSQDPARWQAALREAEALPVGPERWRRLGDVQHDQGKLPEALKSYEAALAALAPTVPAMERALLEARIGQSWLERRDLAAAEAAFRRSLALAPGQTGARTGLVITLLSQSRNDLALAEARAAVDRDVSSPAAQTALALAQTQRGERRAAEESLRRALALDDKSAPAHAWLSFLLRAAGRLDEADEAARRAVARAPHSSLAWQSLSDAAFARGRTREARRAAERAVILNPRSPGAHLGLARARLQQRALAGAAEAANQAVTLAPDVGRAHFFLGVALAEQRQLERAAAAFERAVALDPGYLEAPAFLARVYQQQGRKAKAVQVAQEALSREEEFAPARAALGSVYWRAGQLPQAVREYRAALKVAPQSLLYHLELARVYLDQNNLPDALVEGLEAVHELPGSSEAHAILGLVYDRQDNREQAAREYQEAIALSPDNSLARLGLVTAFSPRSRELLGSGREQLRERAQALLRDPAVLQETFRPGVTAEILGAGGGDRHEEQQLLHRDQFSLGRVHDLSLASRFADAGYRPNSWTDHRLLQSDLAVQATPNTQVLFQYRAEKRSGGLPDPVQKPNLHASFSDRETEYDLSARHHLGGRTSLWLRYGIRSLREAHDDPEGTLRDTSFAIYHLYYRANERDAELRLEHQLGRHALTYGAAALRSNLHLWDNSFRAIVNPAHTSVFLNLDYDKRWLQYLQDDFRIGQRASLIAGTQLLSGGYRLDYLKRETFPGQEPTVTPRRASRRMSDNALLPYLSLTYHLDRRNLVRVAGTKAGPLVENSLLAPSEAFIVGEPINIWYSGPPNKGQAETYELDFEHRFSVRTFGKLFVEHSQVRSAVLIPPLEQQFVPLAAGVPVERVQLAGVRLEQQINRYLSAFTRWSEGEVVDRSARSSRGLQVPFAPRWRGLTGLNYVDGTGSKVLLTVNFLSQRYSDATTPDGKTLFGSNSFDPRKKRPTIGPTAQVDLRIAKEPSVRLEYGLTVTNLFNTIYDVWPGFPARGRTWLVTFAHRF